MSKVYLEVGDRIHVKEGSYAGKDGEVVYEFKTSFGTQFLDIGLDTPIEAPATSEPVRVRRTDVNLITQDPKETENK